MPKPKIKIPKKESRPGEYWGIDPFSVVNHPAWKHFIKEWKKNLLKDGGPRSPKPKFYKFWWVKWIYFKAGWIAQKKARMK